MSQMPGLKRLDPVVLADSAYTAIKRAILSLELEPGSRLIERRLADQFRVSKSPVRDALQRLAGEGLVKQTAYSGMLVQDFDPAFVQELYQVREILEEMAVQLATPRLSADDLRIAEDCLERAEQAMRADDRLAAGEANAGFHDIFRSRSANRPLQSMLGGLGDQVRIITAINWRWRREGMWDAYRQHRSILETAGAGRAEEAGRLMRDHIRVGREVYERAYRA